MCLRGGAIILFFASSVGIVWPTCIPRRRFQNTYSRCKRNMNTTTSELSSTQSPRPYSGRRQRHSVTFFCDAPEVENVTLVGDFNGWDPAATPMRQTPDGRWMATLDLHHGHHRYLFLVDGTPTLDPNGSGVTRDERNEQVSLIGVS